MKVISALALTVATASSALVSTEVANAFTSFQQKFGKQYDNAEWSKRVAIFAENLEMVNQQNADHILAGGEAVFGITKFMDLTKEEFKSMYLTYTPKEDSKVERVTVSVDGPMAESIDWRTKGAVTAVKDQGQCGSCWAFSATEAIESYAFLAGKPLLELSVQQINSCDKVDLGCNGGNTESAYEYIVGAGGLELESDYPYKSGTGSTGQCSFEAKDIAMKITGYTAVTTGEKNLKAALNNGPVSVCVAADAFQTYSGGILKRCAGRIDHCVQAVGYDDGEGSWLVRNSWGTVWGEDGYIRIAQGSDLCHIADDVTFPTFD